MSGEVGVASTGSGRWPVVMEALEIGRVGWIRGCMMGLLEGDAARPRGAPARWRRQYWCRGRSPTTRGADAFAADPQQPFHIVLRNATHGRRPGGRDLSMAAGHGARCRR